MARGAPDYSNVKSGESLHRLDDLSELPPRLGYPISIDRAGEVVALDDFRYGIVAVQADDAGLGETIVASSDYSRYGGFTAKLTRAADASSYASVSAYALSLQSGKIGAEAQFCASGSTPNVKFYVQRYTGEYRLLWGLRWDDATDKIYIGGDTVGWTELSADYDIFQTPPHFHNMKLVVDVDNEDYERVIIDGENVAIAAVDAYKVANSNSPHTVVSYYNGVGPAAATTIYLDYVIITRNEP